jgi:GH15 family glucan-1,4-alpha-glucosidase
LTTNAPISYVVDEILFEIDEPTYLVLMPDESLKDPINHLAETYLEKTKAWWFNWTRGLTLPLEWQDEVIRAAITLKMGHFEETGAFVAAMTTSIPSSPAGGNYDYRYCWLRDATLIVQSLNSVGATVTMEGYLKFLNNIVATMLETKEYRRISSVYGVSMETRLPEREMHRLPGYHGIGPVRLGNKDAETVSNDVFGAIIIALTQTFFDRRLQLQGDENLFKTMELLGEEAAIVYNQADYGTKGTRFAKSSQIHTYSSVLCWAACDRLAKIASRLHLKEKGEHWSQKAKSLKEDIMAHIWNKELNSFVAVWDGSDVDSMILALPEVGFVSYMDERFLGTLQRIEKTLLKNGMILCGSNDTVANNYATFRYICALGEVGRKEDARKLFENILAASTNSLGLLSENQDPETREMWGNFPQNVAMVGLISSAITLSKQWKEAF